MQPTEPLIKNTTQGFPLFIEHMIGNKVEFMPKTVQFSNEHQGNIFGCTISAMYSHGIGPIAILIANLMTKKFITSTNLKKMELLDTEWISIVEKIKKQSSRHKVKIMTLFNKSYLRPYCLIACIDKIEPTNPNKHAIIGIDFSWAGKVFRLISPMYCITMELPRKCCWPIK